MLKPDLKRAVGAGVGANAFKDAGAVMQTVGKHMDLGLIPRDQFSVKPDEFRFLKHGITSTTPQGEFVCTLR